MKKKETGKKPYELNRLGYPEQLSHRVPKLVRHIFRKYGFASDHIIRRWRDIVGENYAHQATPHRLRFHRKEEGGATLTIAASAATAFDLRYVEPVILERINRYFGREVVTRIRYKTPEYDQIQSQATPETSAQTRNLDKEQERKLNRTLDFIDSSELQTALYKLGKNIYLD